MCSGVKGTSNFLDISLYSGRIQKGGKEFGWSKRWTWAFSLLKEEMCSGRGPKAHCSNSIEAHSE